MGIRDLMIGWRNARKVVRQIRNGEWTPEYNPLTRSHLTAYRGDLTLWLGNGPFFCRIESKDYFGFIEGIYVWFAAAAQLRRNADSIVPNDEEPREEL